MSADPTFADLHCHPHSRAFNFMRNSRQRKTDKYNPWTIIIPNFRAQEKGARAFNYSQCDPVKLINGNVRIAFASLYPFEKGFFRGGGKIDGEGVAKVAAIVQKIPLLGFAAEMWLRMKLKPWLSSEEGVISAKDHFQSILMKMPIKRIEYIQSGEYEYYEELKEEYEFLVSKSGVPSQAVIEGSPIRKTLFKLFGKKKNKEALKGNGTYVVARNFVEVEAAAAQENLVFILTIEGMHALGTDNFLPEIFTRIDEIKAWHYPVFFITFAHHFDNKLCGHAHSMPKEATLFVDQREAMHSPFNDIGWAAARQLLSLDPDNKKDLATYGRRIFLDLKHMGARSRQEYYQKIIDPCIKKGDVIPVILSHVGYSGVKTLNEMIANMDFEADTFQGKLFNNWNINACDEDILKVIDTGGLLGLCFDQRILSQKKKEVIASEALLEKNLKGILQAVDSSSLTAQAKPRIWDVLTIGTDFEGYIDPADDYATSAAFNRFYADLVKIIQTLPSNSFQEGRTPEVLAKKICYDNVIEFLKRYF
ncbi:MAG: hypothetical protein ACOYXT_09135 [Bacteroidota bacterium]